MDYVIEVRNAATAFSSWDAVYGGGLVREAVTAQLQHRVQLLDARCSPEVRRAMFGAVGHLGHVTGFMAFDAYAHDDARRMFRFALSCGEEAGDWHLRAKVTAWARFDVLRDIRELRMASMAYQTAASDPERYSKQAAHRLACLRGNRGPRPWQGWTAVP